VRLFPKSQDQKISVRYSDVARIEFSRRDTAAARALETWVKKYQEKKAAGENEYRIGAGEVGLAGQVA